MRLNLALSELIGAIIGDGNIYDKKKYWVELTGDLNKDQEYLRNRIVPIIQEELRYNPRVFSRPDTTFRVRIYSREFVDFLKKLGIPSGRGKGKRVRIPKEICAKWSLARRCIRGILDADGSVVFDKRKVYRRPYPRIDLHIYNAGLINQISEILSARKFNVTRSVKKSSMYLNGEGQVRRFVNEIGFANKKHIDRLKAVCPEIFDNASVAQW